MPNASKYQHGFNIYVGEVFTHYKITDLSIDHDEIVHDQSYCYPTVIDFQYQGNGKPNPQKLLQAVKKHVEGERIIYTGYHDPYACHFTGLKDLKITSISEDKKEIEMIATGHCERIRKNLVKQFKGRMKFTKQELDEEEKRLDEEEERLRSARPEQKSNEESKISTEKKKIGTMKKSLAKEKRELNKAEEERKEKKRQRKEEREDRRRREARKRAKTSSQ